MRIQFTSKDGSAVQGWIESDTPFIKNVFRIFFAVTLDAETPKGCPFSYSFYTSYNDEEDPYFVSGAAYTERLDWLERVAEGFHNIDRISSVVGYGFYAEGGKRYVTLREAIDSYRATNSMQSTKEEK